MTSLAPLGAPRGADPVDELAESANSIVDTVADALPRIGVAIVVVIVGYGLSRLLRAVLRRVFASRQTESFARVMSKVGGYLFLFLCVLAALVVAFPSVKPVDLLAGLGFFSVAVGFAFQDILENTLSGVLLLFRQPFEAGDQIEVLDETGTVEAITIRETRITSFAGELIVIPNRDVYKNVIRVQTHFDDRRVDFTVGVAYENDAREASDVIVTALESVEGVSSTRSPEALVTELGVSTVNISARFWCGPRQHDVMIVRDEAIKTVKEALDVAGIEMPADIVALQATPSLRAALQGDGDVTPGGGLK
ncbi:mechanosensitive ion channel family protein [Ilumatobacter coccineus]|uniref:Small conductance mechanosensitive channel MscS n=1 Tax=Ilumatobacter coccineus (strain NBRC 103263 / KCTC 29153 / YM16-304) TaxID=1313172 RepID=A0A6C7EH32_ILUCY|nr:mechanosensitive ion channel family protein [Ilumatobacter coccineus]BAN03276.1 small conductance mechanosensitive channel MscS [Ilumatobacter coccineus YM16-304]